MSWPAEALGADAVVEAGSSKRDHVRVAIQKLSNPSRRRVYVHTGWTEVDGQRVYLHGGGGVGPHGSVAEVETAMTGSLCHFQLPDPDPPTAFPLLVALAQSLRLRDVAPGEITLPLLAALYRAPLGGADFSLHIAGNTGVGKSELAALAQQHWGPSMDRPHLPANWSSTANALEAVSFLAKDAVLVIDDFAPKGSHTDMQRAHGEADRLLRGQGNQAGRGRMWSDGSLRPVRYPRGLIISTGEDVPRGQSLQARMLVLEVSPTAVDFGLLTDCQERARNGLYAQAMAGYVRWLAAQDFDGIRLERFRNYRERAQQSGNHRRTASIVADLMAAMSFLVDFATQVGVLDQSGAEALREAAWEALGTVAGRQQAIQSTADPVDRFLRLLEGALRGGVCHLADFSGKGLSLSTSDRAGWPTDSHHREMDRGNSARHGSAEKPKGQLKVTNLGGSTASAA